MNRLGASLLAVSMLWGIPASVQASTITYNVSFAGGPVGGSGSFTIDTPAVGSGGTLTMGNGLDALSFTFSDPSSSKFTPVTFTLDSLSSVTYFYQGANLVLAGLGYIGTAGTDGLISFTLGNNGIYFFTDNAVGGSIFNSTGLVSVSQTPLPTSLPLLATGLGIVAMIGWYRRRKTASQCIA